MTKPNTDWRCSRTFGQMFSQLFFFFFRLHDGKNRKAAIRSGSRSYCRDAPLPLERDAPGKQVGLGHHSKVFGRPENLEDVQGGKEIAECVTARECGAGLFGAWAGGPWSQDHIVNSAKYTPRRVRGQRAT